MCTFYVDVLQTGPEGEASCKTKAPTDSKVCFHSKFCSARRPKFQASLLLLDQLAADRIALRWKGLGDHWNVHVIHSLLLR